MDKNHFIRSFSLSGYRSFGKTQRFEKLSKINLFIGQNNSGKSNILRFIHEIYPLLPQRTEIKLEPLDSHIPSGDIFSVGNSVSMEKDSSGNYNDFIQKIISKFPDSARNNQATGYALRVFQEKCKLDGTDEVWFDFGRDHKIIEGNWKKAFDCLRDSEIYNLWSILTNSTHGDRETHWYPGSLTRLTQNFLQIKTVLIPAIRKIGEKGSTSEGFSGEGIIERLVRLQNPDVHKQKDRENFNSINKFLRNVTDNDTATIEIPHDRDTILVHIDRKVLPLESLGTGIHEVIILAAAATILEDTVICMEEPELHLYPILQKKLVRYLSKSTNNQYFITTHSAALMDTPEAEIYHISLKDGESKVVRVTSDKQRSEICGDLGYHPSDLLQSNCLVWVEGPSDRIYLNYWIKANNPNLIEGIHYSIMFYGGRLASHLSGNDITENVDNFISLRRLNRKSTIIMDSDKDRPRAKINSTKERLRVEFNAGPGFAWITDGREIENYIHPEFIKKAIENTKPSANLNSSLGKYENTLSIKTATGKESQASKIDVAKYITENHPVNLDIFDLKKQIYKLLTFIKDSNPTVHIDE